MVRIDATVSDLPVPLMMEATIWASVGSFVLIMIFLYAGHSARASYHEPFHVKHHVLFMGYVMRHLSPSGADAPDTPGPQVDASRYLGATQQPLFFRKGGFWHIPHLGDALPFGTRYLLGNVARLATGCSVVAL
jgi:hypothetical protein